jgi:hypothetical protein
MVVLCRKIKEKGNITFVGWYGFVQVRENSRERRADDSNAWWKMLASRRRS